MGPPRSGGSVSERLAAATATALIGRAAERSRLTALLAPDGPAAVFVHGPGGIGKTALVTGAGTGLDTVSRRRVARTRPHGERKRPVARLVSPAAGVQDLGSGSQGPP